MHFILSEFNIWENLKIKKYFTLNSLDKWILTARNKLFLEN